MSFFGSLLGSEQRTPLADADTLLDLVTSLAGLASNPQDIADTVEPVRIITAHLEPGEAPSAADEAKLVDVYRQLETYITTKEPLRAFTKDGLRAHVKKDLLERIQAHEAKS